MRSNDSRPRTVTPDAWLAALMRRSLPFAFPLFGHAEVHAGWNVPPRRIDEHLIYFVVDSQCEGRVEGRPFRLEPGSFSWIMPGVLHEMGIPRGLPPFKLFFFKFRIGPKGRPLRVEQDHVVHKNAWSLRPYMAEVVEVLQTPLPHRDLQLHGLLLVLFSRVFQLGSEPSGPYPVLNEAQRRHLLEFTRKHIMDRLSPDRLARELRLSPDYFARTFRATFGVPPRRWLLNERIRLAAMRLSEQGLSVSEVAYQFGYRDIYLFSRQFKQVMGASPRSFRKSSGL